MFHFQGVVSLSDVIRFLALRPYESLDESEELDMMREEREDSDHSQATHKKTIIDRLVNNIGAPRAVGEF